MNDLIYNGKSLRELGFAIKNFPVDKCAERDIEFVPITGRSGDAIIDNSRFKNVDMSYEINTVDFRYLQNTNITERRLIDWLMTGEGNYKRLEDSLHEGYFCKAICTGIGDIQRNGLNGFLDTTISFKRQPFWYSKRGQKAIELETSREYQEIENPEQYFSEPLIKVTLNDELNTPIDFFIDINESTYSFRSFRDGVVLDCEAQDVYWENTDKNNQVTFNYMPNLKPGINTIRIRAAREEEQAMISKFEIIPRWRRL